MQFSRISNLATIRFDSCHIHLGNWYFVIQWQGYLLQYKRANVMFKSVLLLVSESGSLPLSNHKKESILKRCETKIRRSFPKIPTCPRIYTTSGDASTNLWFGPGLTLIVRFGPNVIFFTSDFFGLLYIFIKKTRQHFLSPWIFFTL